MIDLNLWLEWLETWSKSSIPVECYTISVQASLKPQCSPCNLCVCLPGSCGVIRPYCAAMKTLLGSPLCFIRILSDGICFVHTQSARNHSLFCAVKSHLLAISSMPRISALVWQGFKCFKIAIWFRLLGSACFKWCSCKGKIW